MNYREKMRKAVECPQFGNIDYGEWGTLRLDQRMLIKRLLDEMDRADEYIKTLYFKNENLQSKIDKAIELIEKEDLIIYFRETKDLELANEFEDLYKNLKENK